MAEEGIELSPEAQTSALTSGPSIISFMGGPFLFMIVCKILGKLLSFGACGWFPLN